MKKIMVVENQEELKNLFRLILQMYNYEVGMAINAESLFTQLEKERSELIDEGVQSKKILSTILKKLGS